MCGSTQQQKDLEQQQANFYQTQTQQAQQAFDEQQAFYTQLMQEYQGVFGEQQGVLSSLSSAFTPMLQAGPSQTGFSPAEESALRTQASDLTSRGASQASVALENKLASLGGGNQFLPSGANAQLEANLASSAMNQNAQQQSAITQANYDTGRQNYLNAAQVLGGVANLESPLGYAGAGTNALTSTGYLNSSATNSGNAAANTANQIATADNAWMGPVFGALGGIAGGVVGNIFGGGGSANPSVGALPTTGYSAPPSLTSMPYPGSL